MSTKDQRVKIVLSQVKADDAVALAKARNEKQERFGAMTYGDRRGSLEAHLLGILPEMAAAEHFGVDLDRRIFYGHGDDGEDLVLPQYGVTQLKATTFWSDPWLRAEVEHDHDWIQTYMLAYVDAKNVRNVWLVGWLPRWEVIAKPTGRLVEGGPLNYLAKESELNAMLAMDSLACASGSTWVW